ncbi:hypothetical protein ACL6C3_02395 [Capilliphycus salinus ALCB114379]|uniref:hypothetical protein n=1 Tax=Capilliphycus salinus TaxID=2768948 RepID=UPI0039A44038
MSTAIQKNLVLNKIVPQKPRRQKEQTPKPNGNVDYTFLSEMLREKQEKMEKNVELAAQKASDYLRQQIEIIFQVAMNLVPSFSKQYWQLNDWEIELNWGQFLQSMNFEERLNLAYQEAFVQFNNELQESLKNLTDELEFLKKSVNLNFDAVKNNSKIIKSSFSLTGFFISLTSLVLLAVISGMSSGVSLAGTTLASVKNLFSSSDLKSREAVKKISESLYAQLQIEKQEMLEELTFSLQKSCDSATTIIDDYFDKIVVKQQ